jgi:16S rRNA (uracil1498-N3)-methyltransferase
MGDFAPATNEMMMARFFIPKKNLTDQRGIIDGAELVHLRNVLRLTPGDRITAFDDAGWEHEAVIRALSAERGEIEILNSYQSRGESELRMVLAAGLTKGEKMDFVVEKATELGVHALIPFASAFSVPHLDEKKITARIARWQKIALAAVKQCGRTRLPEILALRDFQAVVRADWHDALKLFFWEKEGGQSLRAVWEKHRAAKAVVLLIGPEGGFSQSEAALAQAHDFDSVHLGPRILRAETAAVTALSLVQFLWGDSQ